MSGERPPRSLPPGPAPNTIPPSLARKQAILQQAREAAEQHTGLSTKAKKCSDDWKEFFDAKKCVSLPDRGCDFNVYLAGESGPVVFCIHGGGYTGLTFAPFCDHVKNEYRVAAMDMRGHGETECADAGAAADLSKETLAADVNAVWGSLYGDEKPPTVLVGHSVGGAVAVWAAQTGAISELAGVVVIDVVEGTALGKVLHSECKAPQSLCFVLIRRLRHAASLPHMNVILSKRPRSFESPAAAVEWALDTRMSRCRAAATISIPSQLRQAPDGSWVWRTPLHESDAHWEGWYLGLSEAFLALKAPKVLLLAGADRLDKPLTIGQMQGKFQMVLLQNTGHAVHEDAAEEAAETVVQFMKRFRVGEPPLVFPQAALGLPPVLPQAAGVPHVQQ